MLKNLKNYIIRLSLFLVVTLYSVGNNQIAHVSANDTISQSSITFNKTYVPNPDHSIVPDGKSTLPLNRDQVLLPKTGDNKTDIWVWGVGLIVFSLVISVKKIRRIKK